jgi:hypothetical protein
MQEEVRPVFSNILGTIKTVSNPHEYDNILSVIEFFHSEVKDIVKMLNSKIKLNLEYTSEYTCDCGSKMKEKEVGGHYFVCEIMKEHNQAKFYTMTEILKFAKDLQDFLNFLAILEYFHLELSRMVEMIKSNNKWIAPDADVKEIIEKNKEAKEAILKK